MVIVGGGRRKIINTRIIVTVKFPNMIKFYVSLLLFYYSSNSRLWLILWDLKRSWLLYNGYLNRTLALSFVFLPGWDSHMLFHRFKNSYTYVSLCAQFDI